MGAMNIPVFLGVCWKPQEDRSGLVALEKDPVDGIGRCRPRWAPCGCGPPPALSGIFIKPCLSIAI